MADDLAQLKALMDAPPVFVAPTSRGSSNPPQRFNGGDDDMEMAATKATGFPPAPVLKDTGQRDDDGHPIFETTTLNQHNLSKGRQQAPAQFVPPTGPSPPPVNPTVAAALAAALAPAAAPLAFAAPPPAPTAALSPALAALVATARAQSAAPVVLPPAGALQALVLSGVQNALAGIEMLETAGVIPAGRGLSFRQRELLEEITRVLGKLNTGA